MTIANYEPQAQLASYQAQAVQRLGEWASSADAAYKVAERLVQTSFVPSSFRGKPIEATAAILAGTEVGLSPMAALRSFDVIQGQAAPRAITLRAIVQSHGHQMVLTESTETRCRMKGLRRGATEWQTVTWTLDRAKGLGLLGKDNWKRQPGAMLVARATGELARLIAADAILGIGYSAEEIADGSTADSTVAEQTVDATPTGTRRMSRRPAKDDSGEGSQAETSVVEGEAGSNPASDAAPQSITKAQSVKLHAAFNDVGITDREQRLAYCTNLIGREIATSNDLTKAEASQVIDALEADITAAESGEAGRPARSAEGRQVRLDYIAKVTGEVVDSTNDLTKAQASAVIDALQADIADDSSADSLPIGDEQ